MGIELAAPTWPAITVVEAEAALGHFPAAGGMVALEWHSPRPFSAAALVRTADSAFILKRHHRSVRSPETLAAEHRFITHLAARGLSVPEVVPTAHGTSTIALGEWTYELHRKAEGADLYRDRHSWTPFLSYGHAHAAGVALAQLHAASRCFDAAARPPQPLVASFSILRAADPMAATEAYVAARSALAAFLADRAWRPQLARLFTLFGEGLPARLAGHVPLWTHNDWHPSNLLWSDDGTVATVFDFGLADRTCAVHDLATAIERTAVAWLRLGQGADDAIADPGAALGLLAGYATISPFDRAEVQTIVRLLPLVHLEFALSEIDYFSVIGDADQAALALDGYLLGHAEWFRSSAGQDLLRQIDGFACRR